MNLNLNLDSTSRKFLESLMAVISEKITALASAQDAAFARANAAIGDLKKQLADQAGHITDLTSQVADLTARVGDVPTDQDISTLDAKITEANAFLVPPAPAS